MLNATLTQKREITENLYIFDVKPDHLIPEFIPGQYVALGLLPDAQRIAHADPDRTGNHKPERLIRRTYSIASSPDQQAAYSFFVAVVPDGSLSARLAALNPGDRLFVAEKVSGKFTVEAAPTEANLHLVATGTGVAPYVSMVQTEAFWQARPTQQVNIVCGVRYPEDVAYLDELEAVKAKHDNFNFHYTVSRPAQEQHSPGSGGYVQELFRAGKIKHDPRTDHVFLCGNPQMINDMLELMSELGYQENTKKVPGNLHLEKYW